MTSFRPLATVLVLAAAAFGPLAAPAAAKPTTITGKLARSGYVIAGLSRDGRAVIARPGRGGKFVLRFKGSASQVSLSLIGANGRYFGPVVLARTPKRARLVLVGRSGDLGTVTLKKGFAVAGPRGKSLAASTSVATVAGGAPAGAGKLGLVRSTSRSRSALAISAAAGGPGGQPGADPDGDGIASAFDADDDGDLVLDGSDRDGGGQSDGMFSTLFLNLGRSFNAHFGGVTGTGIDTIVHDNLNLLFFFDDTQFRGSVSTANVDCFALSYCRRTTGTGVISGVSESGPDLPRGARWATYDPDHDGLPNLEQIRSRDGRATHAASILPMANTSQIAAGDTFNVSFATSGGPVSLTRTLPPYFVTVPALISYDGGAGEQSMSYPVAQDAPGQDSNPIALASTSLRVTFYRPQRLAIPGAEGGTYVDMGHLHYGVTGDTGGRELACAGDYSGMSPTLSASDGSSSDMAARLFPLTDSAADGPVSASAPLSFTVDLGSCLRRNGVEPAGQTLRLSLTAAGEPRPGGVDRAAQMFAVKLPG